MPESLIHAIYLIAAVLFILSLGGLSHPESARRGNLFGILGMLAALIAAAASKDVAHYWLLVAAVIPGAILGWIAATRVSMTSMPQLVAILHSSVGIAAVFVGIATYLQGVAQHSETDRLIHEIEIFVGVCVGSITFSGSVIAFGKLQGLISGKPLLIPGRHLLNLVLLVATVWLGYKFAGETDDKGLPLYIATTLTGILGIHLVMAIGGADMPVVVSMLNSYSGWSASAAGFMLSNNLLIITGALVGSSGAILSYIMCRGMNRSFVSVILGGFGTGGGTAPPAGAIGTRQDVVEIDVAGTAALLRNARRIVIVPGYGMAVAQAQHSVAEVTRILKGQGKEVTFAIHPVAGRLPGHMNVLLAEANVPYDIVLEMEETNPRLPDIDVVLVIGANDIVNPSAEEDATSPIAGMPVIEVWKAKTVVAMKRGMATGYAGIDNALFYRPNTRMLFGDAKNNIDALLSELRG